MRPLIPVLPITDGNGNLLPFAFVWVLATMAYPEDPSGREKFLAAVKIDYAKEFERAQDKDKGFLAAALFLKKIWPEASITALNQVSESAAVYDQFLDHWWPGILAGNVLYRILQIKKWEPSTSVNKAVAVVTHDMSKEREWPSRLPRGERSLARGERSIIEAWKKFKSVSHLWVAHLHTRRAFKGGLNDPESLLYSLGVAEVVRQRGINVFAQGQTEPVLDPVRTWQLPEDLQIPAVTYSPPQLPAWVKKVLEEYRAPQRL